MPATIGMSTFSRRATWCTAGGAVALDHLADFFQRFLQRSCRKPEREPETPVARLVVGAGQHQIPKSRQPHEGFGPAHRAPRQGASLRRRPRVIKAMRVLAPKPKPSESPAPTASTFFTAPPTSTPTMSVDV